MLCMTKFSNLLILENIIFNRQTNRGHRELSGHLGRKEGGQHWAYANLWFLRLNIVETFRKHFPDVKNNLLVAREAIVTKIRLLCPQK